MLIESNYFLFIKRGVVGGSTYASRSGDEPAVDPEENTLVVSQMSGGRRPAPGLLWDREGSLGPAIQIP